MIASKTYNYLRFFAVVFILVLPFSCSRDLDELEPAEFPVIGEVFIDGFSAGLNYAAFGGSKVTAFQVDNDVSYTGASSMRFEVPDFEDPAGAYAGGAFFTSSGRNLTGFDALTFWAKASKSATIDLVGFGNDLGASEHVVTLQGVSVNTNWKKYYIPIPDPSKLTQERGMFFYSEGPENEQGYTFWIDEVKFEKLGTLAHPKGSILDGQDQVSSAETGDRITIGGLTMTHNLPTGIDQTTNIAPAYFNFSSSDQSVATVGNNGQVTVLDAGETVITATIAGEDAAGSLTLSSTGEALLPPEPAPTPTRSQDSVISMFSNVYNDVLVDTWNPFWEFSTAEVADVKIGDDDVKRYKNLNFVGILTEAEKIDATEMTHFHIDIWTPDPTAPPASFKILIVDFGADGNFGGGDDSSHELSFTSPTLATESWVSLDIPLSDFVGLTSRSKIAQLVLSGEIPNVFVDNVYYYNSGETTGSGPGAAPTPTENAADVISLYSNAYDDVTVDTWSAEWDQAEVADVQLEGDDAKLYTGLNFAGIEFTSQTVDASSMDRFHMDIWTPDPTAAPAAFRIKIVDFGADGTFDGGDDTEHELTISAPPLASNSWVEIDLPLSDFTGLTTTGHLAQIIISGDPNTVYVDNVYFYRGDGGGGDEPTIAAPMPTQAEGDVISLFSDAYTDEPVDTWRTEWSDAAFEDVTVAGDAVKKYSALNFVGIETVANTLDISEMTHFHVDVWSPDFTDFGIKLVDFGADGTFDGGDDVEHQIDYANPAQGQWISYDIPLSDFVGLTTTEHLAQYIFVGQPTGMNTVYIDNMYFYKDSGGGGDEPTVAAPTPTQPAANVISLFSDAYTDEPVDTWRTEWSDAVFEDVTVAGDAVKKYSALNFVGIETVANTIDVSGMTHFHIDVWSPDFTDFGIKLVDFGADGTFDGGDDVEHQIDYANPAQGQWISYDIPLSDFVGLTTTEHLAQYILVGQPTGMNTIYVDNIYFYSE
jgi:hypothetical protein